ncbi:hypothetical protein AcW1_005636 [Taiwanofungus camphoratus]|nr:hypothetical protein AcW2_004401 [Antrodia cinnamomea]KAI0933961.1 hypothetical protein AcV5_005964 [Antrodia cinnamomea]KAI0957155.1 hypothetical protein AcW1_005636 [Antrodia cinnamomea]
MPCKKIKTSHPLADGGENGVVEPSAPPALGRRTIRGKRGALKDMPNMPVDIVIEVCNYLEPRDLLYLARTSKAFRALLMTRTSAHLWKAARNNLEGFPGCPPHLSEPEYANLAFSPHCHNCLKNNVQKILWDFNVRYCSTCKKELTGPWVGRLPYILYTILSSSTVLNSMRDNGARIYHVPQISAFERRWADVEQDEEKSKRFIEEQTAVVKQIKEHADLCKAWAFEKANTRANELDDIRGKRLESIITRLRELGWDEDLNYIQARKYYQLTTLPQVRVAKTLTDRGWVKIRDEVVACMESVKARRLAEEWKSILERRLDAFSSMMTSFYSEKRRTIADEMKPLFADFAFMPEIRNLIEAPRTTNITSDTFLAIRGQVPALIENWEVDVKERLAALITERIDVAENVDPVDLAVAFFECRNCQAVLEYPDVVGHPCLRPNYYSYMNMSVAGIYDRVAFAMAGARKWSCSTLGVSNTFQRVRSIVQACGKDPSSTTRQEMDDSDIRLWQRNRVSHVGVKEITTWRAAAQLKNGCDDGWDVVSEDEKKRAKELEASYYEKYPDTVSRFIHQRRWCCSLCFDWRGRNCYLSSIVNHLRAKYVTSSPVAPLPHALTGTLSTTRPLKMGTCTIRQTVEKHHPM